MGLARACVCVRSRGMMCGGKRTVRSLMLCCVMYLCNMPVLFDGGWIFTVRPGGRQESGLRHVGIQTVAAFPFIPYVSQEAKDARKDRIGAMENSEKANRPGDWVKEDSEEESVEEENRHLVGERKDSQMGNHNQNRFAADDIDADNIDASRDRESIHNDDTEMIEEDDVEENGKHLRRRSTRRKRTKKRFSGHDNGDETSFLMVHLASPLMFGFLFGFIGAIPVAGPTAATVLKYGLEQLYREGRLVALGSSLAESTYAGIAFWGFTTFMAQMQWIFPIAKLVGGFVLVLLGGMFMRYEHSSNTAMKTGKGAEDSHDKDQGKGRAAFLMGFTISVVNPGFLATYSGAITTAHGTGMLMFFTGAPVLFGLGVFSGINMWFFILLHLLKRNRSRFSKKSLEFFINVMGGLLFVGGVFMLLSSGRYIAQVLGLTE